MVASTSHLPNLINVLIHSAATVRPKEAIAEADGEGYIHAVHDNVAGSLYVAPAFLRHAAPDAVVVAINSSGSYLSLNNAFAWYCVAKMAVFRLWNTVAIANPELSIFHTQPGVILSQMNFEREPRVSRTS
ncbi:hypothetical protein F4775DRAFT_547385 [Biscogniauxia sp. FL1348]|nr:hypothetical protein F4775DRAFT_547385 [Biscogniauxia sp. FL1348]